MTTPPPPATDSTKPRWGALAAIVGTVVVLIAAIVVTILLLTADDSDEAHGSGFTDVNGDTVEDAYRTLASALENAERQALLDVLTDTFGAFFDEDWHRFDTDEEFAEYLAAYQPRLGDIIHVTEDLDEYIEWSEERSSSEEYALTEDERDEAVEYLEALAHVDLSEDVYAFVEADFSYNYAESAGDGTTRSRLFLFVVDDDVWRLALAG